MRNKTKSQIEKTLQGKIHIGNQLVAKIMNCLRQEKHFSLLIRSIAERKKVSVVGEDSQDEK